MEKIYQRYLGLSEWLRWILFLPLSFAFMVLAELILSLVIENAADFPGVYWIFHPTIAIVSYSIALYLLVPRAKHKFVLFYVSGHLVISILALIFIIVVDVSMLDKKTLFEFIVAIPAWIAGFSFYRHIRPHSSRSIRLDVNADSEQDSAQLKCAHCSEPIGGTRISAAQRYFCSDICHLRFWQQEMPNLGGDGIQNADLKRLEALHGQARKDLYSKIVMSVLG